MTEATTKSVTKTTDINNKHTNVLDAKVLDDAVAARHEHFPNESPKYLPIEIGAILQPGDEPIFQESLCEMEDPYQDPRCGGAGCIGAG